MTVEASQQMGYAQSNPAVLLMLAHFGLIEQHTVFSSDGITPLYFEWRRA